MFQHTHKPQSRLEGPSPGLQSSKYAKTSGAISPWPKERKPALNSTLSHSFHFCVAKMSKKKKNTLAQVLSFLLRLLLRPGPFSIIKSQICNTKCFCDNWTFFLNAMRCISFPLPPRRRPFSFTVSHLCVSHFHRPQKCWLWGMKMTKGSGNGAR